MGEPRLTTKGPEFWRYGPVFARLYPALRVFGRSPISVPQSMHPFEDPPIVNDGDPAAWDFIEWIWKRYGHLSAFSLSDLTRREGTPWQRTAVDHGYSVPVHTVIRDEFIHEEFAGIMNSRSHANEGAR